ncbi:methionyl-tRNA formyltransferase [Tannockella kyphosi]|uniref:methionyl-tRNA formyltransferase n=1 Tax=Tannockella kyphosi TaxID=2899121 RepID=UPI0020116475|nr:methionyl-tRNA formyltransferase [Tannockella kyphosi]
MKDKKILFMGTATFSKEVLEKLIENNYSIIAVVTQPDRYVGRKKEIKMPEVKEVALAHNIPVYQMQSIKQDYIELVELQPDLIITAAYGQIIPEALLESASIGAINVHASLLPMYRGGAPVHQAIIDGQDQTGVTIMYMVKQMDAGNIISQAKIDILDEYTTGVLYDLLATVGANLLIETLPSIIEGTNASISQDSDKVTFSPIITRDKEKIDFNKDARAVFNQVRGLNPWPVGYTIHKGNSVKLWSGFVYSGPKQFNNAKAGTIVDISSLGMVVSTGDGFYVIDEFQVAGKRRMFVKDFLNGNNLFFVGDVFE